VAELPGAKPKIHVYPNPTSSNLVIDAGGLHVKEVQVIDLPGKVVFVTQLENNMMNISQLPKGVYILKIMTDSEIITQRIIKN
jgi:hypothetical protein